MRLNILLYTHSSFRLSLKQIDYLLRLFFFSPGQFPFPLLIYMNSLSIFDAKSVSRKCCKCLLLAFPIILKNDIICHSQVILT